MLLLDATLMQYNSVKYNANGTPPTFLPELLPASEASAEKLCASVHKLSRVHSVTCNFARLTNDQSAR